MCDCFLVSFQKGYARSPESAYHPAVFHAFPCDPSLPAPSWHFKMGRPDTARNVFRLRVYVYCRRQIQNDRPGKKRKNLIIQNLNEAVVVTDLEGRFLFLNPMAETLVSSMKKKPSTVRKTAKSTIFSGARRDILTGWITTIRSRKRNCKAATPHRDIC